MSNTKFFVPIDLLELKEVIEFLTTKNIDVNLKIDSTHAKTHFVPSSRKNLTVINKFQKTIQRCPVVCSFDLKSDQYFFKSFCQSEDHALTIDLPEKIFKLQRRNNFRINIPLTMPQTTQIQEFPHLKPICRNLSLGGCQLSVSTARPEDFKINDLVRISLSLFEFQEKNIESLVRFIDYKSHSQTLLVGLQFLELDSEQASLLQKTLVRIDRFLRGKDED